MATQHTRFQNLKLIAGAALIGFGVFIQVENLTQVAAQVNHLFGISAERTQTLGVLIAFGLAASRAVQAYLFNHQEFLRSLYQISLSFWPLLAVIAGTFCCCVTDSRRRLKSCKNDPVVSKNPV